MSSPTETNGIFQTLLLQKSDMREPFLFYLGHSIHEKKFRKETERCARSLLRWGIKPGSTVFLCLAQTPELLYTLFAIWQLGGIAHLISPDLPPKLVKDYFSAAKGELLFLSEVYAHRFCGILNSDPPAQTILVPLQQSLPVFHRRIRGIVPPPSSSISYPRLLLWKEFLESGKSLCAAESPAISPDAIAAVFYPPFPSLSAHSLSHSQICNDAKRLSLSLPSLPKGAHLLSQVRPWEAESLSSMLLPFYMDLCLLLEPRSSHSDILQTILTEKVDILHCNRSFFLWVNEQGLSSSTLSRLFVLHSDAEAQKENASPS